jgi:hypothetical protein
MLKWVVGNRILRFANLCPISASISRPTPSPFACKLFHTHTRAHSHSLALSDTKRRQEILASNIQYFLDLIEILNEHKAELTTKIETLNNEKSTKEQEQTDCMNEIEQLKQTINGQELGQEELVEVSVRLLVFVPTSNHLSSLILCISLN